ncbi:MAG TPA: alpha/beta hydrolase, partial [Candidatus Nanopelagicales bacterium]|nr:alpha/beta hydrolase [Candidatus Nanopelagicales bacterium]
MSVLTAGAEAYVESEGVRLHYEVTGVGGPTILLLPTWTVVHKRFWKAQVPYLSRHFRVVIYDGPGNGRSGRPLEPAAYDHDVQVRHALAVLDATATDRAVLVSLSQASAWALQLAAEHPDRVLGAVFLSASITITDGHPARVAPGDPADLPRSRVPQLERDPLEHWSKYDPAYWRGHHEDFLWFFFGMCFPEPHSTKQIED